jgi:flagellar motor switch protein FliM
MVEKVLNQEQIDAMVRAVRGGKSGANSKETNVTLWDARQAGQIGREQMRAINSLHETFARSLTHSLGAYLRMETTAALVSAEHLTYGEFMQRVPEMTYLATLQLGPMSETAVLQLDLSVAFPIIDVLLGGEGKGAPPERNISDIEEQILEILVNLICRELDSAWQDVVLKFTLPQRQSAEQIARLMPLEEKTLTLSFELTLAEARGTLILMVPAVVSNAMLRKMSAGWAVSARPKSQSGSRERLRQLMLDCPFRLELEMMPAAVSLKELASLAPGGVLALNRKIEEPARITAGGRELFTATPARKGTSRAASVLARCEEKQNNEEEERQNEVQGTPA